MRYLVDPPDGRLPALTEAGRERARSMGSRSSFTRTPEREAASGVLGSQQ